MSTASCAVTSLTVGPVNLPIDTPFNRQARSPEGQGSDAEEIERNKSSVNRTVPGAIEDQGALTQVIHESPGQVFFLGRFLSQSFTPR
jgi:hypothetical protein